jgi:hypothetical protein
MVPLIAAPGRFIPYTDGTRKTGSGDFAGQIHGVVSKRLQRCICEVTCPWGDQHRGIELKVDSDDGTFRQSDIGSRGKRDRGTVDGPNQYSWITIPG